MAIKPEQSNEIVYEPVAAGTYPARLYSVIHIGRVSFEWQGETKVLDKVRLTFELPTETKVFNEEKGEQPFVLSREFTLSMHEKANLRKFLESWQGKRMTDIEAIDTDIEEWIGRDGLANVVHAETKTGNVYAMINNMSPLPKGMKCPNQYNPNFILNYQEQWSQEKFDSLPDFLKQKIMSSSNYQAKFNLNQDDDIDIKSLDF